MSLVTWTVEDGLARVTLARPGKRNALSPSMLRALVKALDEAGHEAPRVLILEGEGPVFCAGGDIASMEDRLGEPHRTVEALRSNLNPAIMKVATFPAPTIAKVQGAAVGAGLGLALACDLVVAAEGAKLGAVHTRLGLTPDGGTSYFLPHLVGLKRAMDMVLSAETITASHAVQLGMVSRAVSSDELERTVEDMARRLAKGPTLAYLQARRLLIGGLKTGLDEALEREARSQGLMYATEDQREGVEAFRAKRDPAFRGG
ncbi:MAG: enoyl-CoA hydratase-related protein [Candidatus Thermoplasmatota archaeon]|nr:enoyl-CoA hydratase-related protein [Candidatus Thermoplasmatota archaeon]